MAIDSTWIDAEINRLQRLKEITADPEMLALVRRALSSESPSSIPPPAPVSIAGAVNGVASANGQLPIRRKKGELKNAVRAAALRNGTWFNGYQLTEQMQKSGFVFYAAKPSISVMDILRGMVEDELLEMRPGAGNDPHEFRVKHHEN